MKHLLNIAMLLVGLVATPVHGADAAAPAVAASAPVLPACLPYLYGKTLTSDWKRTDEGRYAYAWCEGKSGQPLWVYAACVHGTCMPVGTFAELVDALKRDPNPLTAAKSAWLNATWAKDPCPPGVSGPMGKVCADVSAAMIASKPASAASAPTPPASGPTPTPALVYVVKTNGTSATRPAYTLANGVRGTKEVARATVGQLCDRSKPILASGADEWASFGPSPVAGIVALCTLVK
jgi:hypothetical protein